MSAGTKAFYYVLQGHVGATKLLMQIMLLLKIPTVQILKTELLLKPFLLKTKRVLKLLSLLKFTVPTLIILLINFFFVIGILQQLSLEKHPLAIVDTYQLDVWFLSRYHTIFCIHDSFLFCQQHNYFSQFRNPSFKMG